MRRKLTIMLVTAAVLALIVATAASSMLPTYEDTLEAKVNSYEKLTKTELLDTMKTEFAEATQNGNSGSLIPIASVFHQRRAEYTADELLSLIEDNSLPTFLRITVIQVLAELSGFDGTDERLSELLEKDIPDDVKRSIIANFGGEGSIGMEKLVEQAFNEDRYTAYQALKSLGRTNTEKACEVSRKILKDYKNANIGQIKESLNIISGAHDPELKMTEADIKLLYEVADYVLDKDYPTDAKDTVIYALSRTNTIKAVEYIMHHEYADEILRTGTILENWYVLVETLENNPTEEDISLALECMELQPLTEVLESLEDAIESKPQLISSNIKLTQKRVSDILEYAKKNADSITVLPDLAAKGGLIDE